MLLSPWNFPDKNGLPFPTPGDIPDPGIEPVSPVSSVSAGRFFTAAPPGKPFVEMVEHKSRQLAPNCTASHYILH